MKRIFATVGTTSFDQFVKSICSASFISATLKCQNSSTSEPPSDPLVSPLQSTSDLQHLWQLCEILRSSESSCCTQPPSEFSQSSCTENRAENDVEILIQYGRGKSPAHFLPSDIREGMESDNADDEGFLSIRFPTEHVVLHIKWYRFKPSLIEDMKQADLILCHAGAGTLLEALSLSEPSNDTITNRVINAVINSRLMDNHQTELADELERRGQIMVTREVEELGTSNGADAFWIKANSFVPKKFHRSGRSQSNTTNASKSNFQQIVDRVMGISN